MGLVKKEVLFLAVALLAVALVTAGCVGPEERGGEPEGRAPESASVEPAPAEMVRVAYRTTTGAETARVYMVMETSGGEAAGTRQYGELPPVRVTVEGVVDFASQNALLYTSLPLFGEGFEIESRVLGDTVYQRYPEDLVSATPGMKPWVRMSLDDVYRKQVGMSYSEMQGGAVDPTEYLAYLRSVSDSVEEVGTEPVRGAQTTRYRAEVDLNEEAEELAPGARRKYREMIELMGTSTLPVDVWLDPEGRVRRYEMTYPLLVSEDPADPSSGLRRAGGEATIVQELYDFGVPVEVASPPEKQTMDYKELEEMPGSGR
jgi:hypothetical protein